MENAIAIVVAAGKGERMATGTFKQFMMLNGKPMVMHSLEVFDSIDTISEIILVVPETHIDYTVANILPLYKFTKSIKVVKGGLNRQQSVFNGLSVICDTKCIVAIHDGARPLLTSNIIERGIMEANSHGAVILGVPLKETVKLIGINNYVLDTLNRDEHVVVQTPQFFRFDIIHKAHKQAIESSFIGLDDSVLVERIGFKVKMIEGSYRNIKITTIEDMILASRLLHLNGEVI